MPQRAHITRTAITKGANWDSYQRVRVTSCGSEECRRAGNPRLGALGLTEIIVGHASILDQPARRAFWAPPASTVADYSSLILGSFILLN
jgi:hypothetical protein